TIFDASAADDTFLHVTREEHVAAAPAADARRDPGGAHDLLRVDDDGDTRRAHRDEEHRDRQRVRADGDEEDRQHRDEADGERRAHRRLRPHAQNYTEQKWNNATVKVEGPRLRPEGVV